MGPLRRHDRLQQDGTPKRPVETLSCQSAVQGGCRCNQGKVALRSHGASVKETRVFVLAGERHVPSRPVRSQVRHPSGHRWQLQVQKQRPISCSVLLLQGKSSMLVAFLIPLSTLLVSDFLPILSKLFFLIGKGFSHANRISFLDLNPYLIQIHL